MRSSLHGRRSSQHGALDRNVYGLVRPRQRACGPPQPTCTSAPPPSLAHPRSIACDEKGVAMSPRASTAISPPSPPAACIKSITSRAASSLRRPPLGDEVFVGLEREPALHRELLRALAREHHVAAVLHDRAREIDGMGDV